MARSKEDIKVVTMQIDAAINIDIERLETDPVWRSIILMYPDVQDLNQPLMEYLSYYLSSERLLTHCPATCGPAEPNIKDLEIL